MRSSFRAALGATNVALSGGHILDHLYHVLAGCLLCLSGQWTRISR